MAKQPASGLRQVVSRNVVCIVIGLVAAAMVFGIYLAESYFNLPMLGIAENQFVDLRFQLRGPMEVSGDVVIVAIDSKSIEEIGRWPWPRSRQAELVDRLRSWGASAVAFDVLFQEPQGAVEAARLERIAGTLPVPPQDESEDPVASSRTAIQAAIEEVREDRRLADAMLRTFDDDAALTVMAFDFFFEEEYLRSKHLGKLLSDEDEQIVLDIGSYLSRNENIPYLRHPPQLALGIRPVVTEIAESASLVGYANPIFDQDGAVRRERIYSVYSSAVRHAIESKERTRAEALSDPDSIVQAFMPLAIAAVATHLRMDVADLILDLEKGVLQLPGADGKTRSLPFDPVDGTMKINFYGAQATFPTFPFVDVVQGEITDSSGRSLSGEEAFAGKLVFVGYVDPGLSDTFVTPFTARLPGVEKHANVAEVLLHGSPLWRHPNHDAVVGYTALGVGLVVALLVGNLSPILASVVILFLTLAGLFTTYQDFVREGLIWNWIVPLVTLVVGYSGITVYRQLSEAALKRVQEARSQFVQATFGRYLSQEVVTTLLYNPEGLHLGGQRKMITILMSDLRGFTALCERSTPEVVIGLLNLYLGKMADTVLKYQGTVDEFIGDAVLALFGAPRSRKDDAQRAIACAIEMQRAMPEVNSHLTAKGLPEVEMGIALNTGDVIVGNIGSEKRTKYGVVGSNVNLTARIESYTVGGQVLISGATLEQAGGSVDEGGIVEVGDVIQVKAKGLADPIPAYLLLGIRGEYDVSMPEINEELFELPMSIQMEYELLEGKKIGSESHSGHLVRISKLGGDLRTSEQLPPLTNIKMRMFRATGEVLEGDLYAKIVDREASEGCLAVRFTSVPPAVKKHLKAVMKAIAS